MKYEIELAPEGGWPKVDVVTGGSFGPMPIKPYLKFYKQDYGIKQFLIVFKWQDSWKLAVCWDEQETYYIEPAWPTEVLKSFAEFLYGEPIRWTREDEKSL